jgi:general secretion pathway protein G
MSCKRKATDGKQRRRLRRAFTLVELMVVIVIIGLLAGAVTLSVRSYLIASKQNVARMEISKICQALDTFYAAYDRYPSNEQGLEALVARTDKFPDGLLNRLPRDPWGNGYEYNHPGRNNPYEVISYGADGHEGGEGADRDISSENLQDQTARH